MASPEREREVVFRGTERFVVERKLGTGGMGVVYRALDTERNVPVALKVLRFMDASSIARFKSEFRALADLVHRNLIRLGELYCEDSHWFFTMELVEGQNFLAYVATDDSSGTDLDGDDISPSADTLRSLYFAQKVAPATREARLAPRYNEVRLRSALAQLTQGVHALHAAGKVHRDIKPSNVLVTSEGRVALVDFGLVMDALTVRRDSEWTPQGSRVVGTAAYMAPEQGASRIVGPEADWYSVGVVLYEALTGRPPFLGRPLEVLTNKQRFEPTPPRAIASAVPPDLDLLCVELLRWDPKLRPSARDILARLGALGEASLTSTVKPARSLSWPHPFVGRQRELSYLEAAWAAVRQGTAVTCFVHGESGLGKSALVREFTERVQADDPRAVILCGRCYERESVPYKAVDGVVDALSRYLRHLKKDEVLTLLPLRSMHLAQVFPLLRQVEAVAEAPPPPAEIIAPLEQRSRVFLALRELFGRLAERSPLVVCIDDLQWADKDSLLLLREIMRPPSAPGFLLIATVRTVHEGSGGAEVRQGITTSIEGDVRHLHLTRLSSDEAKELAHVLVERSLGESVPSTNSPPADATDAGTARPSAATIAEEAGGHPLFIDELVRHLVFEDEPSSPRPHVLPLPHLEEVLWKRIARLEPLARYLLELVAVAGGPLPQEVVSQAAKAEFSDFAKRVSLLRAANLVQTTGTRRSDPIETYHDRVRTAVLSRLEEEPKRYWHERLAVTLEALGRTDPDALAVHWQGAGERGRASRYAAVAATQAVQALAFDRAARLFRLALSARPERTPETRALRTQLGDALVNAGHGGEAAEVYLDAAVGAPPAEALDLKRRCADQLLRTGHTDRGMTVLAEVLESVGLKLHSSPRAALFSLLWSRARIRLRGLSFRTRDTSVLKPSVLTRIDVCWSVGVGLSFVDFLRGADFQSRQLLLALQAGEPYRVGRALAGEAGFSASAGGRGHLRTARLIQASASIAEETGHPHLKGLVTISEALAAMMEGRWRQARDKALCAESILRESCTGVAWEMSSARLFGVTALAYMGQLAELSRRVPIYLREAEESGDLYLATTMRTGEALLCWLAQGDAARARREATLACENWSADGVIVHRFFDLLAQVEIDLYEGQGQNAWQRICDRWPLLERSLLLSIQMVRIVMQNLRGRAALAAAAGMAARDPQRPKLLRSATKDAQRLLGERMPWSNHLAELLRAQIASLRGNLAQAERLFASASLGLESIDMGLHAAAARLRQSELSMELANHAKDATSERHEAGAALRRTALDLRRTALEWMDQEGVRQPLEMARLCAPVGRSL